MHNAKTEFEIKHPINETIVKINNFFPAKIPFLNTMCQYNYKAIAPKTANVQEININVRIK